MSPKRYRNWERFKYHTQFTNRIPRKATVICNLILSVIEHNISVLPQNHAKKEVFFLYQNLKEWIVCNLKPNHILYQDSLIYKQGIY